MRLAGLAGAIVEANLRSASDAGLASGKRSPGIDSGAGSSCAALGGVESAMFSSGQRWRF
jgi:hypothetical protein